MTPFQPFVLRDPYQDSNQAQTKQGEENQLILPINKITKGDIQNSGIPNLIKDLDGTIRNVPDIYINTLKPFMDYIKGLPITNANAETSIENTLKFFNADELRIGIYLLLLVNNEDPKNILKRDDNKALYDAIIYLKNKEDIKDIKDRLYRSDNPANLNGINVNPFINILDLNYIYTDIPALKREKVSNFILNPAYVLKENNFLVKSFEENLISIFGKNTNQQIRINLENLGAYLKSNDITLLDLNKNQISITEGQLNNIRQNLKKILKSFKNSPFTEEEIDNLNLNDTNTQNIILNSLLVGINRDFGSLIWSVFIDLVNSNDAKADENFKNIFNFDRSLAQKYFKNLSIFENNYQLKKDKKEVVKNFLNDLTKAENYSYLPTDLKTIVDKYKSKYNYNIDNLTINDLITIQRFMLISSLHFSVIQYASGEIPLVNNNQRNVAKKNGTTNK